MLITILLLNLPPGIIGGDFPKIIVISFALCSIFYFLLYKMKSPDVNIKMLTGTIWFIYLIMQNLFIDPDSFITAINYMVSFAVVFYISGLFFQKEENKLILKYIVILISILAYSNVITTLLIMLGINIDTLLLSDLPLTSQELMLIFPITLTEQIGNYTIFGYQIPRVNGLFVEPGIYQAYILLSFFGMDFIKIKRKTFIKVNLFLSLILTFSLSGIVNFVICYLYKMLFLSKVYNTKQIVIKFSSLVLFFLFAITVLNNANYTRKMSKRDTNITLFRRMSVTSNFFSSDYEYNRYVGSGFRSKMEQNEFSSLYGVNIISSLSKIGLIGVFLFILLTISCIKSNYNKYTIMIILPFILSLLTAQSFHYHAIYYFWLNQRIKPQTQ